VRWGQVAQLVEQRTENPRVGGSIPSLAIQGSTDEIGGYENGGHLKMTAVGVFSPEIRPELGETRWPRGMSSGSQ
jgi:hypothetical protein